jgi:hypothetical protein
MRALVANPVLITFVSILFVCGCSGGGSGRVEAGFGTVEVHITDAPLDLSTVQSVIVTLTGVIVYPRDDLQATPLITNGGPIHLMQHPATFDLLTLTGGATELLASGEVPAGDYSRIRLEVSEATLVYHDNTTEPLKIEPNKVDVPIGFHVSVDGQTGLTLDFDAAASVKVNETSSDKFILRPVVTPVQ